jgi:hypothetical protein
VAQVALLTLHGMGVTLKDYADELQRDLLALLGDAWQEVAFESVYYQDILQPNQRAVWNRTRANAKVRWEGLRTFVLSGLSDAVGIECRKERAGSAYELAQLEIARKLLAARDQMGGNGAVVFLTQSLGAHVLSNYLWDAQLPTGRATAGIWQDIDAHAMAIAGHALSNEERDFLRGGTLRRWVSTGCNIPVFVAADMQMSIQPIRPPTDDFHWLNIYDPDDALGWPLRPLGNGYEELVDDRTINAGQSADVTARNWNPLSHTAYWTDKDVLGPLSEMLKKLLSEVSELN